MGVIHGVNVHVGKCSEEKKRLLFKPVLWDLLAVRIFPICLPPWTPRRIPGKRTLRKSGSMKRALLFCMVVNRVIFLFTSQVEN